MKNIVQTISKVFSNGFNLQPAFYKLQTYATKTLALIIEQT